VLAIPLHRRGRLAVQLENSVAEHASMRDDYAMLITFARAETGSTIATIRRRDGVVVELPGFDKKHRVPHDLAHVVTERALGLSGGVFGSIASGAMFSNMRVIDGKPRHDAAERSRRVLHANRHVLGVSEVMAGVVHDAVEHDTGPNAPAEAHRNWTAVSADPFPWTDQHIADAVSLLARLSADFQHEGVVEVTWPDTLSTQPPAATGVNRGRRGRK
jgi:hypothetical protein